MSTWTTKLLVIANRTADSTELRETLLARAAEGPILVTLLAPATPEPGGGSGEQTTAERLHRAVERLREAGIAVEGVLGDPDPVAAVHEIWDPRHFDEVIVATLPGTTSRWLAVDLPRRVQKLTDVPVKHIVATAQEPVS